MDCVIVLEELLAVPALINIYRGVILSQKCMPYSSK